MNVWLLGAAVLVPGLAPCLWLTAIGRAPTAAVGAELAGAISTAVLMLMAAGFGRTILWDLALVSVAAQLVSGLVIARFLRDELWWPR
jgi:multisubunit Na+/H+ antiporter MnhF subunit